MRPACAGRWAVARPPTASSSADANVTLCPPWADQKNPNPLPNGQGVGFRGSRYPANQAKKSAVASLSFQQLSRPSSTPSPAPAFCENVETHGTNRLAAGEIGIEICVLDTSRIYPGRLIYCHSCFALGVFPKHALGRPGPAQHPGRRRLEFLAAWLSAKRVASAQGADGGVKRRVCDGIVNFSSL
jgi:hypothetical protein